MGAFKERVFTPGQVFARREALKQAFKTPELGPKFSPESSEVRAAKRYELVRKHNFNLIDDAVWPARAKKNEQPEATDAQDSVPMHGLGDFLGPNGQILL